MTQPKQTPEPPKSQAKDHPHAQTGDAAARAEERPSSRSAAAAGSAAEGAGGKPANEPNASAAEGDPSRTEELERRLQTALASAAENQDKFLRAKAEADNVRKRAESDIADAHKYGVERFAMEMLAVRDSLEAAKAQDLKQGPAVMERVLQGLDLTLKLMEAAFKKFGIGVIDSQGEKFDPEKHQAMSMVETAEVPPNHVVQVVQKGYSLHNRLIRPALVVVSKAPAGTPPAAANKSDEQKSGSPTP